MKNVLVTGGTGFVGANLSVALIRRGCAVTILRRENSNLMAIQDVDVRHCIGDVRDADSVRRAMRGCDTVFHTAALVTFQKSKAAIQHDVNVTGTKNVVEACIASGVEKLVHTSSVAAIGHPPAGEPALPVNDSTSALTRRAGRLATEETLFNWERVAGYKYSKYMAEQEILKGVQKGLDAVMVNPSVIVGERDIHFHGGDLIRRVRKFHVPFYIEGGMNVVYVGDVVNGHIAAAEKGRKGERYILAGENLTHKEIFRRTAKIVGGLSPFAKLPLSFLRFAAKIIEQTSKLIGIEPIVTSALVAGAGKFNWFSSEKATRELGYTITPFDETIRRAYAWYYDNNML